MPDHPHKGPKGPSNNHPNRNWRRAMVDAAEAYLDRYNWPSDGVQMLTPAQLQDLIRAAYQAGYGAGRASVTRKRSST